MYNTFSVMTTFCINAKDDNHRRDRFSSNMDQSDVKENYIKSLDVIKELKKQNNSLQDAVKRLKARSRWPDHVQAAVCNKEVAQEKLQLQTQLKELSNQCSAYERQIEELKLSSMRDRRNDALKSPQAAASMFKHESSESVLKSQLQKCCNERKLQEKAYKQHAEELTARLAETEERLAQVLRLRTMDAGELIRVARASKLNAAQLTSQQEEAHQLKTALELANTKIDELNGLVREERDRVRQLTEEAEQTQLLRHSLQESAQELLELREENTVLRESLQSVVTDPGQGHEDEISRSQMEEQCESASSELRALQHLLDQERHSHALERRQLEAQLVQEVAERERMHSSLQARHELDVRKQELQLKRRSFSAATTQVPPTVTQDQAMQTLEQLDFKPPDVSCAVTGEESDRILAQVYSELESHRELVRTQQHLTQLYKHQMEGLQQQLRGEREHYAAELSHKMARLQELQNNLPRRPVPAPRVSVCVQPPTQELEGFEVEIESITATADSPLLGDATSHRLFLEFVLLPAQESKSIETPGNFEPPSVAGESVIIAHTHTWSLSDVQESLSSDCAHVQFTVVGEPQSSENEDCSELGTATFELSEALRSDDAQVTHDLELVSDAGDTIGQLRVTCRKSMS